MKAGLTLADAQLYTFPTISDLRPSRLFSSAVLSLSSTSNG
jgi:hypothetical protein